MKKLMVFLAVCLASSLVLAHAKSTYLSCPQLDERASDLKVVLNQENGTASLQTSSGGPGLNFTSPASFGPDVVQWRKDSHSLKQTYSVDRSTLVLERKTLSGMTDKTYSEKSNCTVVSVSKRKF